MVVQWIILSVVLALSVAYTVYRAYRSLTRKTSLCDGCEGCRLKENYSARQSPKAVDSQNICSKSKKRQKKFGC